MTGNYYKKYIEWFKFDKNIKKFSILLVMYELIILCISIFIGFESLLIKFLLISLVIALFIFINAIYDIAKKP